MACCILGAIWYIVYRLIGIIYCYNMKPLKNPIIVIASEAKQSQNMLIIHKIATSRHALLAAKGSLAPRNDQN